VDFNEEVARASPYFVSYLSPSLSLSLCFSFGRKHDDDYVTKEIKKRERTHKPDEEIIKERGQVKNTPYAISQMRKNFRSFFHIKKTRVKKAKDTMYI
jgi:hypothetical protein